MLQTLIAELKAIHEKNPRQSYSFMQLSSFETEIKVIIIGNGRVGKTSLLTRFVESSYTDVYRKTLGVDYLEKKVFVSAIHEQVTFYIYDTAGQEEYDSMTRSFYRGAGAAIVAFSTVDRGSFLAVPRWLERVREECGQIPIVLVQTKIDMTDTDAVTPAEADSLSVETGLRLYRVCAKDNINVTSVFEQLCFDHVKRRQCARIKNPTLLQKPSDMKRNNSSVFSNCVLS